MTFHALRQAAIDAIKFKLNNGEFTERGLARLARISQSQVNNLLAGRRTGSLEMLDRICGAARVEISELAGFPSTAAAASGHQPRPPRSLDTLDR